MEEGVRVVRVLLTIFHQIRIHLLLILIVTLSGCDPGLVHCDKDC